MKKIIAILVVLIAGLTQVLGQVELANNLGAVIKEDAFTTGSFTFNSKTPLVIEGALEIRGDLIIDKNSILIVKRVIVSNSTAYRIRVDKGGLLAVLGFKDAHSKIVEGEAIEGYESLYIYCNNFNGKSQASAEDVFVYGDEKYNSEAALEKAEKQMAEYAELLPIELTYFTVSQKGQDIEFEWKTASETNNDYFTIEYSIDGISFYELTTVAGSGTTSEATSYSYVWNADEGGLFYFRLKQTDYNGEYSYSKVVALKFDKETIQGIYFQNGKIMYNGSPLRL